MKHLLLASAALLTFALPAHATVIQSRSLPGGPYSSPIPSTFTPDVYTDLTGSVNDVYLSPFAGTTDSGSLYTAVEGNGSATFDVSGNVLSFIWGSPDTYNNLGLYSGVDGTGKLLGSITGGSIAPANGTSFSYVTISDYGTFGSLVFSNSANPGAGSNAFEISTLSVSSVPLPASLPMFGAALLALTGFAWVARGRRSQAAAG